MILPFTLTGKQPKISVWLDETNDKTLKQFHCPICGSIVFEYYSPLRIILPGEMSVEKKSPIVIQCHGSRTFYKDGCSTTIRCKAKYWIES